MAQVCRSLCGEKILSARVGQRPAAESALHREVPEQRVVGSTSSFCEVLVEHGNPAAGQWREPVLSVLSAAADITCGRRGGHLVGAAR